MLLVAHDLVMAADPHDTGQGNDYANARAVGYAHGTMPVHDAADSEQTACGTFEAARTEQLVRDAGANAVPGDTFSMPRADFGSLPWAISPGPGISRGQLRALLQVYLI